MKKIIIVWLFSFLFISIVTIAHEGADASHASEDAYWAELAQTYPAFSPRRHKYLQRSGNIKEVGQWGEVIDWPHVAVSAANLPDGRVITWSASQKRSFPRGSEFTYASTWNPTSNSFVGRDNTFQDMFASHLSLLEDGRLFVNGGNNHVKTTSIFDYRNNSWSQIHNMNRGRWYPTTVALPSGEVFTALGSSGGRYPEVWNEKTGWKVLTGAGLYAPILQYENYYEREWWPLLHVSPQGNIFHSGPTPQMHNISTKNLGSITQVGIENRDWYPKHGTTVMFDEGKLLVAGGAISGENKKSINKAMIIDINGISPVVSGVDAMKYPRKFHNGVMLPTGEVMVIGGNTTGVKFSDQGSVLPVEIWNPETKKWREGADSHVPRNYHSIALLMPDARVLSAGGGLCNCVADHENGQLYSPGYLFNSDGSKASRPTLSKAPNKVKNGQQFSVQSDANIKKFSLVKMSSTTHAVNTDLRYLAPKFVSTGGGRYTLTAHANKNVLTPGYWMLFAVNQKGVPSIAKIIQFSSGSVSIEQPEAQAYLLGSSISLDVDINGADAGQFSAENLPEGLEINNQSGVISGEASKAGIYNSKIKYTHSNGESEIQLSWNIYTRGGIKGVSYEAYNGTWNTLPDFPQLSTNQEVDYQGVSNNFTVSGTITSQHFAVRLSATLTIERADDYLFYLASVDGSRLWVNGKLLIDNDGLHALREKSSSVYLSQGSHNIIVEYFVNSGSPNLTLRYSNSVFSKKALDQLLLTQNPLSNIAPVMTSIESQSSVVGDFVSLNVVANDANGDPLIFFATGLPNGLNINSATGVISGVPSLIGPYSTSLKARDAKGAESAAEFTWEITGGLNARNLRKKPQVVNKLISYPVGSNSNKSVQYKWDFGDGSETGYSSDNHGLHRFTKPGSYTVTLTAKDESGDESSSQFVQAVYLPHAEGKPKTSMSIVYNEALGVGNIWNVNPDNHTVTGFNASTLSKLAEIPVGKKPRSLAFAPNGELWVSNKGSHSISIIDTKSRRVIDTILLPYASQPYGIVFSKKKKVAYIALEASGQLLKINVNSRHIESSLPVGKNPRHISLSGKEDLLYISRYITPTIPDESTLSPKTALNGVEYGGEVIVVNTNSFSVSKTIVLKHSNTVDSEKRSRGIPNYLGGIALSPDGKMAWVPSKQDNIKRGLMRDGQNITFDSAVRSISSKINLSTNKEELSSRVDHDNGGIASTAIFGKYGSYLFVALEGSREIEVIDAYNNEPLFRISTKKAPQGLAISDNGLTLYSHNFMDRSLTVFDLFNLIYSQFDDVPLVATLKTVADESLSPSVLRGKQLFYDSFDPRLSKEQYSSCAGCHNEGRGDGRIWDMSGFGEGLRNTISLIGHGGMDQGMLHWSGNFDEIQDFEGQIRGLSAGAGLMNNTAFHAPTRQDPLGTKKAGVSTALDDLAAYISSLKEVPASPYRNKNGALSDDAKQGKALFTSNACDECHSGAQFTDSAPNVRHDIGTLKPTSGRRLNKQLDGLDTPTLLGLWQTAPYLHDGSASTITEAIIAHNDVNLSDEDVSLLARYLKQLDNEGDIVNSPVTPSQPSKGSSSQSGGAMPLVFLFFIYLMSNGLRRVKRFI